MKSKKKKNKSNDKNKKDIKLVSECFEEGYEDPKEAQLKEAKRRIEEEKKPFNPMDFLSTKNIIIFIIWYSLYRLFLNYNFAAVYFMLTIIVLIFLNLGQRKPGELSAYSIFNPNHERIIGSMSNNNFGLGHNQFYDDFYNNNALNMQIEQMRQVEREINEELDRKIHYDTKNELRKEYLKSKAEQPLNSNCSCGSGKKYKNCCLKKIK